MKILIITFNFGKSSSGKTTERITDGLYNLGHEIEIICGQNYTQKKNYKIHRINPNPLKPSRLFKILGNLALKELNYIFWEFRAKKAAKKIMEDFQPDILYSRGSPVASMTVGDFLKRHYNKPHIIHFADPIPPTTDWMKNKAERKKLLKTIKPIIKNANTISFVTEEMRTYQNKIINEDIDFPETFISPNPMPNFRHLGKPSNEKFIFLYLGTFSRQRNPKLIIEAFQSFAINKENVEFHIYGNKSNEKIFNELDLISPNVKLYDATNEIHEVLRNANALVDVDAEFNEQVFISGKLMEYLSVDRFIIAISPLNSPARRLLRPMKTTTEIVSHKKEDITHGMEKIYRSIWKGKDYEERNLLQKNYNFKEILKQIDCNLVLLNKK